MGSGNAKFLVGLGIGSAIGALVYHFSRTAKAKKLKNDVFNRSEEHTSELHHTDSSRMPSSA